MGRLVQARCEACHARPGIDLRSSIDLSTYATARPWARAVREAILGGHGHTSTDGALTSFERELLIDWIDGGAPERTPAPSLPAKPPSSYIRIASPVPSDTLAAYRAKHGGTASVVPGLGLTLTTPDMMYVFDRDRLGRERVIARGEIVPSLEKRLASLPRATRRTRISDAAYAIGPSREPRREIAELTPEGPDRFWCPMHPEVRSPIEGTCPRCRMALVAIPPFSLDSFALEIADRERLPSGDTRLTLRVTRGADRTPVTSFLTLHEKPFHLFVVDHTLTYFQHVHPEIRGAELIATLSLPSEGRYTLVGDFTPLDGSPQLRVARLSEGRPEPEAASIEPGDGPGTSATLTTMLMGFPFRAGVEQRVSFSLLDRKLIVPPDDLEPYLGASAHMFAMHESLREPIHAHPVEAIGASFTAPAFDVRFPREGRYALWLQVQRAGRVETLRFTVDVSK